MTTLTVTREEQFAKELDRVSLELYSQDDWETSRSNYETIGIDIEYYDMQCHALDELFTTKPDLFEGYQWINSEDGMPLWVRPGVDWRPEYEYEDDHIFY